MQDKDKDKGNGGSRFVWDAAWGIAYIVYIVYIAYIAYIAIDD